MLNLRPNLQTTLGTPLASARSESSHVPATIRHPEDSTPLCQRDHRHEAADCTKHPSVGKSPDLRQSTRTNPNTGTTQASEKKGSSSKPIRLLLDSRVVELTKARHPIFVILSSSKPLSFKRLQVELQALAISKHKTPESSKRE